jgi:hypothetical protein
MLFSFPFSFDLLFETFLISFVFIELVHINNLLNNNLIYFVRTSIKFGIRGLKNEMKRKNGKTGKNLEAKQNKMKKTSKVPKNEAKRMEKFEKRKETKRKKKDYLKNETKQNEKQSSAKKRNEIN